MMPPPLRTLIGFALFVLAGAAIVWGIRDRGSSDDVSTEPLATVSTAADTTTTTLKPATKAEAVAQINAVCREFLAEDPTNAPRDSVADFASVARLRISAIDAVLPMVDEVRAPEGDEPLRTEAKKALLAIAGLLEPNASLPDSPDPVASNDPAFVRDEAATIQLAKLAVTLYEYGAKDCVPGA